MRRIVADPASHGLAFAPIANQPYFAKVDVGGQLDLHVAAELAELPKEELLALNPAFNHWVTDPDGPHQLLVPVDRQERFTEAIAALPPEKRVRVVYHRVRQGDTLGGIADKYGISVAALKHDEQDPRHPDSSGSGSADRRGTARAWQARSHESDVVEARRVRTQHVRQACRASRRHAVEHRAHARREHGQLASTQRPAGNGTLSVGQVLKIPGTATLASTDADAVSTRSDDLRRARRRHAVAHRHQIPRQHDRPARLEQTSSSRSVIKPGQRLVMYVDDRRAGNLKQRTACVVRLTADARLDSCQPYCRRPLSHIRLSLGAAHGISCRQARTDRRPRDRALHRLRHRAGDAPRRRGAGVQLPGALQGSRRGHGRGIRLEHRVRDGRGQRREHRSGFATLGKKWDGLDIVVHAVAFAPSDAIRGGFVESTTRENFRIAHDISSYSLTALAKAAEPMMAGAPARCSR